MKWSREEEKEEMTAVKRWKASLESDAKDEQERKQSLAERRRGGEGMAV